MFQAESLELTLGKMTFQHFEKKSNIPDRDIRLVLRGTRCHPHYQSYSNLKLQNKNQLGHDDVIVCSGKLMSNMSHAYESYLEYRIQFLFLVGIRI